MYIKIGPPSAAVAVVRCSRPSSVRPNVSRQVPSCPVVAMNTLCLSIRPVVRPIVVVLCPSVHLVVVVRPLSVRPVVHLIITYMTSRSIRRMGTYVSVPTYVPVALHLRSICVPFAFLLRSICVPFTFQKERKGNETRACFLQEKVPWNAC